MFLIEKFVNGLIDRVQEYSRNRKDGSHSDQPARRPDSIPVGGGHTLQDAIDSHQTWIESEGKQGHRFSFENMDMRNIDFSGTNLTASRMTACDLRGSKFDEATLEGVNFQDSDLQRTSFTRAKCARAQFVDTDLSMSDLSEADLSDTNFRWAHLEKAKFKNSNLHKSHFRYNTLDYADMSGANLSEASFGWVVMEGADLRGANLSHAVYKEDDFAGAIIDGPMKGQTNAEYHASLETAREQARATIREQTTDSLAEHDPLPELGVHDSMDDKSKEMV